MATKKVAVLDITDEESAAWKEMGEIQVTTRKMQARLKDLQPIIKNMAKRGKNREILEAGTTIAGFYGQLTYAEKYTLEEA